MKKISNFLILIFLCTISTALAADSVKSVSLFNHKSGKLGTYKAVIIGLDKYRDSGFRKISTTSPSLKRLAIILKKKYGFRVETFFNSNATKKAIEAKITKLKNQSKANDNILIYFSGHGELNNAGDKGWWIPYDGVLSDKSTWISNEIIVNLAKNIRAKDLLVISDAAFSDNLFGSSHKIKPNAGSDYFLGLYNKKSRWCFKSGTKYTLTDSKGKAVVVPMLIDLLQKNNNSYISTIFLFDKMKKRLRIHSRTSPARCRSLRYTGDKGGELVFVAKSSGGIPSEQKTNDSNAQKVNKPAKPANGKISVRANVPGAIVSIDGKQFGRTPVEGKTVKPGKHVLKLTKPGYQHYAISIIVGEGASLLKDVKLEKEKPKKGILYIDALPENSSIKFKGKSEKFSQGMELEPGKYNFSINAPFYETKIISVIIEAGKESKNIVKLDPLKKIKDKVLGSFVLVEKGSFMMGSPASEPMRSDSEKLHSVELTHNYYMQTTEVTCGQWRKFVKSSHYKSVAETSGGAFGMVDFNWEKDRSTYWDNPGFPKTDKHPVTCISWKDVNAFVKWMNKHSNYTFRLPTEAEWEYACRAGSNTLFSTGDCISNAQATFDGNSKWKNCPVGPSPKGTSVVAKYPPNKFGIYDMHGNVREYCHDWYGAYPVGNIKDPVGPASGTSRVSRGGDWTVYIYNLRSAKRYEQSPDDAYSNLGFRLVIEVK